MCKAGWSSRKQEMGFHMLLSVVNIDVCGGEDISVCVRLVGSQGLF